VERSFPRLVGTGWAITSDQTPTYNCIAWAVEKADRWWWPTPALGGNYWPAGVPRQATLFAFQLAYATEGYELCKSGALEDGFQKVAVYADAAGNPKHAARQLPDGRWASKLGENHDIEHDEAEHIGGTSYGEVAFYMRRVVAPA
jgi:hypothetical protein